MWWTVEYTDGSDGELYFNTERYEWVLDGHTSPWYSWEPKREWYLFMWWSPEETNSVTSDITYVAQREADADWDGIPDTKRWTVEYTDGSNGELYFNTERYEWVLDGHASPWYSWEPKREWYVFMWWSPEETNNVRSDITYVAQWKLDSNWDGIPDVEKNDNKYSEEFNQAYQFAYKNWITTKNTIESANMNWNLTRIAMAKMLSQYAINVLWQTPDYTKVISFSDVTNELDEKYDNWVTLAYQLWIMWIWINNFRPNDKVTRAEFWTALSRMLYWIENGVDNYYSTHLNKLQSEWIVTNINPEMQEKRWYVMIMLMRSTEW